MYEEVTLPIVKTHYCEMKKCIVVFMNFAECDEKKTHMCHQTTSPLLWMQHISDKVS